jgi:hypothetical protein
MTVKFMGFLALVYVASMTVQVILYANTPPAAPFGKSDWTRCTDNGDMTNNFWWLDPCEDPLRDRSG